MIYLGTSGWSYPSGYGKWAGVFYPKRWQGDELAYYADRFPAVEVNATFYRLPTAEMARQWVARTPGTFRFCLKLYRKFTHPEFYHREEGKSPEILPTDVASMRATLDVLANAGRLGALLVQYPEFFHRTPANVGALTRTLTPFRDYPLAVELRDASWEVPQTREVLGECGATFARIDEPFFQNHDEPFAPADTISYWRLHGRNAAQWRLPGAGHRRYEYLYARAEIADLADAVQRHTGRKDTFVFSITMSAAWPSPTPCSWPNTSTSNCRTTNSPRSPSPSPNLRPSPARSADSWGWRCSFDNTGILVNVA